MVYRRRESYIDCPTCGPGSPAKFNGSQWYCINTEACKRVVLWSDSRTFGVVHIAKPRTINVASLSGRTERMLPQCNGVCTNGKTSCDCRCRGKCHGAGRCLGGHG